ncbi:MAG: hypothetical protein Kow00128_00500 [Deltaproteobacteria bacterium]
MKTAAPRNDRQDILLAFRLFEEVSGALRAEFRELREEASRLRAEVEEKNAQLERGLEEHRRWMDFLATILERIPGGILVLSPDRRVLASNGNAERFLGLCRSPSPGSPLSSLGPVAKAVDEAAAGGGTRTLKVGPSPEETRFLTVTEIRLPESGGAARGHLLVLEDITDSRRVSDRTEQARRLASMGDLASRLAHEIRNPLTTCRFFLAMARQDLEGGNRDGVGANLEKLDGVLGTLENTVSNMLGFIRRHRPSFSPFEPESLVRECLEVATPLTREGGVSVQVENRIPGRSVVSDPGLLRQAFLNLIVNAIQSARGTKGTVTISISRRFLREDLEERPFLLVSFADTGPGIPEEILPRIFDPFYSTRRDGTGLGLTIVQSIVHALGGFVEVDSRPGEGARFRLLVPDIEAAPGGNP